MYSEPCCFLSNHLTLLPLFHNQSHSPRPLRRGTTGSSNITTTCSRWKETIPWTSSAQQKQPQQQESTTTLSALRGPDTGKNEQAVVVATNSSGVSSGRKNLHTHVSQALRDYHEQANASTQRGKCTYALGRQATDALYDARALVRHVMAKDVNDYDYEDDDDDDDDDYHDDSKDQVVFAHDAVHAMHTLATSVCRSLSPNTDMIVLSALCAAPVLRVWHAVAAAYGVTTMMTAGSGQDGNGQLDIAEFAQCLTSDTGQQRMRVVVLPLFNTSSDITTRTNEMDVDDVDDGVYKNDDDNEDDDDDTPLHAVVPFLKSVGALTIIHAIAPTPPPLLSSLSLSSSSSQALESSNDDNAKIDIDNDNDISQQHEGAVPTTVSSHLPPPPPPPRLVINLVKRTRRVCNPDIVVTDVSVTQDGLYRPAFMIAPNAVWKTLPPAVDGERSLVEHSLDASDAVFDKRWQSKWAPVPSRFECETATAPVAVAVAAALEYVVASHDDDDDM